MQTHSHTHTHTHSSLFLSASLPSSRALLSLFGQSVWERWAAGPGWGRGQKRELSRLEGKSKRVKESWFLNKEMSGIKAQHSNRAACLFYMGLFLNPLLYWNTLALKLYPRLTQTQKHFDKLVVLVIRKSTIRNYYTQLYCTFSLLLKVDVSL